MDSAARSCRQERAADRERWRRRRRDCAARRSTSRSVRRNVATQVLPESLALFVATRRDRGRSGSSRDRSPLDIKGPVVTKQWTPARVRYTNIDAESRRAVVVPLRNGRLAGEGARKAERQAAFVEPLGTRPDAHPAS